MNIEDLLHRVNATNEDEGKSPYVTEEDMTYVRKLVFSSIDLSGSTSVQLKAFPTITDMLGIIK